MLLPAHTQSFTGFGPCSLGLRLSGRAVEMQLAGSRREIRRQLRECCTAAAGVYGMLDAHGRLIYVGKAKSLRRRLLSYFHAQAKDAKAGEIIAHTSRLVWERTPHELVALARELELIRRFLPRFNVQGRPDRFGRAYVCVGRAPAPYVFVADEPTRRADACYGPLRSRRRLAEAVRYLNQQFRLRDCPDRVPMVFRDQLSLFDDARAAQCARFDMETCLAPCAGGCSRSEYGVQVRAVQDFLDGGDSSLLEQLESRMIAAAEGRHYERAAMLRDVSASLDWLHGSLARLRVARRKFSFLYPVQAASGRTYWLAISRGQIGYGAFAPHSDRTRRSWRKWLTRIYPRPFQPQSIGAEDVEMLLLVTSWFRRFPDELKRVLKPRVARKLCGK
ncbi:MAG: GIY-YIG nuclease family protein [Pirellulales bacterium]